MTVTTMALTVFILGTVALAVVVDTAAPFSFAGFVRSSTAARRPGAALETAACALDRATSSLDWV
jgi:hypothetical protein